MKVVFFQRKPRPKRNFSLEILFNQIRANLSDEFESKIEIAKYYSNGFFKRLWICIDAIGKQGDVNHVTGDINFATIFLKKKKTILTILDIGFMNHPNAIARWILKLFWIKLPVNRSSFITTISEATKNELLKYVEIEKSKIKVLYIPVAGTMTYKPKEFNTNCPIILQVGTKENKNLFRVIEAIKDITCKLRVIGVLSDNHLQALKKYNINYENLVNISDEELMEAYEQSDMLVFVSTYEGFGMPIVEAQIVGRPVITSNLLSMPEVAGNGALIVDPYNVKEIGKAIQQVINDGQLRYKLIEEGKKNHRRFSVDIITKQYEDLYRAIYNKTN